MDFPKELVKRFLKTNWILMIIKDPAKADYLQLVLTPRTGRGTHNVPEPFDGLTEYVSQWLDTPEVVAGTDVCVAEERKYVTLKLENSAGASEESK